MIRPAPVCAAPTGLEGIVLGVACYRHVTPPGLVHCSVPPNDRRGIHSSVEQRQRDDQAASPEQHIPDGLGMGSCSHGQECFPDNG